MVKNRYDSILREGNAQILELTPGNETLRAVTAFEIRKLAKPNDRILEIGCGEGDSTLPILEKTNISLDVLDVSKEMIEICKKKCSKFISRTKFICVDALEYLSKSPKYNIITTSWTIHNFPKTDQLNTLQAIYSSLAKDGYLVIMDKLYPPKGAEEMLQAQKNRYLHISPELRKAICEHEDQDFTPEYRINEKDFIQTLSKIGFTDIKIIDRVERDVVLVAKK